MAFLLGPGRSAEGHAVIESDVIPDFGRFTDNDAHAVIDKEPLAYLRPGMNFNTGKEPPEM